MNAGSEPCSHAARETGFLVVGAGPVGTLMAATLIEAGHPVRWVVRNEQRRSELAGGLRLLLDGQPRLLPLEPGTVAKHHAEPPASAGRCTAVVCVKSYQVAGALGEIEGLPSRQLIVVANGIHEGSFITGVLYGGARIACGVLVTGSGNRMDLGPGWIGDTPQVIEQAAGERIAPLGEALSAPWLCTSVLSGAMQRRSMWTKAALNCVVNPLTALRDVENGVLLDELDGQPISSLLDELSGVLAATLHDECCSGDRLAWRGMLRLELRERLETLLRATAGNSSSMREDLRNGRRTEIRELNIAMAEAGSAHGLPCPDLLALGQRVIAAEVAG